MWDVHFSAAADSSTTGAYVEAKPSPTATATFSLFVIFIHLLYMFVLHEVSSRVPAPEYLVELVEMETLEKTEETEETEETKETEGLDAKPRRRTMKDIIEENVDDLKGKPWCKRFPAEVARTSRALRKSMRDGGVMQALLKYMTFSRYSIRYYVKNTANTLEDDDSDDDSEDSDFEAEAGNVLSNGLSQMSHPTKFRDYISNFLRFWLALSGIISMALYFCFFWNLLVEFLIKCVLDLSDGSWLGFFVIFFLLQVVMWFTKRVWDSLKLMWYNTGDALRVKGVFYWRLSLFLTCLFSTVMQSTAKNNISVSDNLFWQVMLRQMVLVGMWWAALFVVACIAADAYTYYCILYDTPANVTLANTFTAMRDMKWWDLCFLRRDAAEESKGYRVFKRVLLSTLLLAAFVCFITGFSLKPRNGKPVIFVSLILFWYYIQVFGRRAKWKALYELWAATRVYTYFDHKHNNAPIERRHTRAVSKGGSGHFDESELKDFDEENEVFHELPPGFLQHWCKRKKERGLAVRMVHSVVNTVRSSVLIGSTLSGLQTVQIGTDKLQTVDEQIVGDESEENQTVEIADTQKVDEPLASDGSEEKQKTKVEIEMESPMDEELASDGSEEKRTAKIEMGSPTDEELASDGSEEKNELNELDLEVWRQSAAGPKSVKAMRRIASNAASDASSDSDDDTTAIALGMDNLPEWLPAFFGGGYLKTIRISWMEFWNTVHAVDGDYLGYGSLVNGSCECCGIFVMLLLTCASLVWAAKVGKVDNTKATESDMVAKYGLCQLEGNVGELSIMDLAFFTEAPYHIFRDERKLYQQMEVWFGANAWLVWDKSSMYYQPTEPSFFAFDMLGVDKGVVAVRGTKTFSDVLQDVSLYSEVAVLQSFSYVIPLTKLLPVGFLRDWVWLAAKPEGMIDPKVRSKFDKPVDDFVDEKYKNNPNIHLTIAGHSLGGTIAQIVAARMVGRHNTQNIFSFGLSSSGTIYSSAKFGFSVEALDKTSLSVLPRRDPIANVDLHGGLVQIIECDAVTAMHCHSSTRSFCELYSNCGTESARNQTLADCVCDSEDTTWDGCMGFTDDF